MKFVALLRPVPGTRGSWTSKALFMSYTLSEQDALEPMNQRKGHSDWLERTSLVHDVGDSVRRPFPCSGGASAPPEWPPAPCLSLLPMNARDVSQSPYPFKKGQSQSPHPTRASLLQLLRNLCKRQEELNQTYQRRHISMYLPGGWFP